MKKRKSVEKIELDVEFKDNESKPKCFGTKCASCREDLCGEWYSKCAVYSKEALGEKND